MVLLVSVRFFFLCMRSVLLGVGIPSGVVAAGESDLLSLSLGYMYPVLSFRRYDQC